MTKDASLDFLQAIVGDAPELPTPSAKRARCAIRSDLHQFCSALPQFLACTASICCMMTCAVLLQTSMLMNKEEAWYLQCTTSILAMHWLNLLHDDLRRTLENLHAHKLGRGGLLAPISFQWLDCR